MNSFQLRQTITNPTPGEDDFFGLAVGISDDRIIIGSPGDSTGANNAGSAYLFNTNGNLLTTINNPTPVFIDAFGTAVSIDGEQIVITSPLDNSSGFSAGTAYLYNTNGNLVRTINNPTPEANDSFGYSATIENDLILIGSTQSQVDGLRAGSAYLYNTNGNLQETIDNPFPTEDDLFGHSVSISGDRLLIGSPGDNSGGTKAGSAFLFDTNGNLIRVFDNPDPGINDNFGFSVSISGDRILIGAVDDDINGIIDAGSAYLFNVNGTLIKKINNPTPEEGDFFGQLVSIDGDKLLIGALGDNTGATDAGSAYVFDLNGNLLQTLNNPTPEAQDYFGFSGIIRDNNIVIGTPQDNTGGQNSGSAYLFQYTNTDDSALTLKGGTAQIAYVAYYGRPADPSGVNFWNSVLTDANVNYSPRNGDVLTGQEKQIYDLIVNDFGNSAEADRLFSGLNNRQKVNQVYNFAFNRDAETEGLNYWTNQLNSGNITLANFALEVALGAQNEDIIVLNNKITSADLFSNSINTNAERSAYAGSTGEAFGRDWLAPFGNTIATQIQVDIALAQLVAQS